MKFLGMFLAIGFALGTQAAEADAPARESYLVVTADGRKAVVPIGKAVQLGEHVCVVSAAGESDLLLQCLHAPSGSEAATLTDCEGQAPQVSMKVTLKGKDVAVIVARALCPRKGDWT